MCPALLDPAAQANHHHPPRVCACEPLHTSHGQGRKETSSFFA
ncbi:unnamed protein product [Ectocarpus sp. CCAP 1310/34]|nr:unnamed protein product [Ectocarpus sp. CCAP 1310/34]